MNLEGIDENVVLVHGNVLAKSGQRGRRQTVGSGAGAQATSEVGPHLTLLLHAERDTHGLQLRAHTSPVARQRPRSHRLSDFVSAAAPPDAF